MQSSLRAVVGAGGTGGLFYWFLVLFLIVITIWPDVRSTKTRLGNRTVVVGSSRVDSNAMSLRFSIDGGSNNGERVLQLRQQ